MSIGKLSPRLFIIVTALMFLISLLVLTSCGNKQLTEDEITQRVSQPIPTEGPYRNFPAGVNRDEAVELRHRHTELLLDLPDDHECEAIWTHIAQWLAGDANEESKAEWKSLKESGRQGEADILEIYMQDEWTSLVRDLCPSVY